MFTATKIGSTIFAGNRSGLTRIVINPDDTMTAEGSYYSIGSHHSVVSLAASAPCGGGYVVGGSEAIVLSGIDQPSEPDVRCAIKSSADFVSAAASGRFLYLSNQSEGLDVCNVTPEPTIANVATLDPLAWENLENPRTEDWRLPGRGSGSPTLPGGEVPVRSA